MRSSLSGVPFTEAWHSPLQRAEDTASIMTANLPGLHAEPCALLFDCIPSGPTPDMPHAFQPFFCSVTEAQIDAGQAQMTDAVAEWLTPSREDRHTLLITHNFVIGWFVREVFEAPAWRFGVAPLREITPTLPGWKTFGLCPGMIPTNPSPGVTMPAVLGPMIRVPW